MNSSPRMMGLIGQGISYSLSPMIHNESARRLGIDTEYRIVSLPPNEVGVFLRRAWEQNAMGFNITQPHKKLVARLTGSDLSSVNTLYRGEKSWNSASTDGVGLAAALERFAVPINKFHTIAILGAGGAAISVLEYLDSHKFGGIVALASRRFRSAEFVECGFLNISPIIFDLASPAVWRILGKNSNSLVIQATSAPLQGDDLSGIVPLMADFTGVYVDMVYGHHSAPLMHSLDKGLFAFDGIPMLVEQARASQKLWWGVAEDYESIERRLRSHARGAGSNKTKIPTA